MSTATISRTFRIDDEVTVDSPRFPGVYVITKVPVGANGVNYVCKPKGDILGRGVRARASMLIAHESGTPAPSPVFVPYVQTPDPAVVVTIHGIDSVSPDELFVVLGDSRTPNCVSVARLGGDHRRKYSAMPVSHLTVVDILARLAR